MTFDNVIPIDADVAQQLARRQIRFRWLAVALFALWLAVAVPTLLLTPLPPLGPFIALAILVVLAEHRFVLFGDETSMSASILVVVASIFVFADTAPLAGPLLVASIAGLYFPHLRDRAAALAMANVSIFGLSAAIAAALVGELIGSAASSSLPGAFVAAAGASAAYWYANSVLTGIASATRHETLIRTAVTSQATSEWPVLLLAIAVGLFSKAAGQSTVGTALGAVVCLVCFEVYVRNLEVPSRSCAQVSPLSAAVVIGTSAAIWHTNMICAGVAVIGSFAVISGLGPHFGRTSTKVCVLVITYLAVATLATVGLPVGGQFFGCALASLAVIRALELRGRGETSAKKLPLSVTVGHLIPSLNEAAASAFLGIGLSLAVAGNSQLVTAVLSLIVIAAAASAGFVGRHRSTLGQTRATCPRSAVGASR